jgi:ribose transport system ATP-binding protein
MGQRAGIDSIRDGNGRPAGLDVVLRVAGVRKAFGGTQALDSVTFELRRGTIHALLGGNGSGKSTMVKILAGVVTADAGEVQLGQHRHPARELSPALAHAAGLRFVHQHTSTFEPLTVAENLSIGRGFETRAGGTVRWRSVRRRTAEVLRRFEIDAEPDTPLERLRPATRTLVAIARALQDQEHAANGILVLDEPTASLPEPEVELVLAALRRYAAAGQTIMYITHRLEEAVEVADQATVFRDGQTAATIGREAIDHDTLVELIVGRSIQVLQPPRAAAWRRPVALRGERLAGGSVREASLVIHRGEILGLAGLLGSGRSTLLRILFGLHRLDEGEIELDGEVLRLREPADAIRAGIVYIPEDRPKEAAFPGLTVSENIAITQLQGYWRRGRLDKKAERRDSRALIEAVQLKCASESALFSSLSGGNQQKCILARWLQRKPRILLLDEPTQGVDVGARAEIWKLIRAAAAEGAGALVASSDADELARACDRALVLRDGRIAAELAGQELTENRIDQLTHGPGAPVSA